MNNTKSYQSATAACLVVVVSLLAGPSVFAAPVAIEAPQTDTASSDNSFGIGLTFSRTSRQYEGIDDQSARLPYISARLGDFYVDGLNIGYNVPTDSEIKWGLVAVPRFLGYKESNSPILEGLDDTDYSYHGGLTADWNTDFGLINVKALTDLLNESGGSEVVATLSKAFNFGELTLSPAVSLNWQNADLVDHYYGVTEAQSTADRPAYEGESVVNTALSLSASYALTEQFRLIGQVRQEHYGSEIEDSPLVDENTALSTSFGLVYTF